MLRLANLSIRHPVIALAAAGSVCAVLVAIGFGVMGHLSPTKTFRPGTESTRAEHLAESEFGPGTLVPILLTGPQRQLDRQGPIVVGELKDLDGVRVLSAWDAGEAGAALRPRPNEAMLVVSVAKTEEQMLDGMQDTIDRTVEIHTFGPVNAHITGQPTLDRAIEDEAVSSTRWATAVALPILFVALLLVLQAPVAALVTTAVGGVVAFSGFGLMSVVAKQFDIDAIGVGLASIMGLALGTGLSLMIIARFRREEARLGNAPDEAVIAATRTVASTGRAVLIAGTGLLVSLLVASLVGPTENLMAIGTGVTINAALATGAAVVVVPAVLALLGTGIFRWSFGTPKLVQGPWRTLAAGRVVLRRAVYLGAAATAALIALAIPAFNMETGPPDPSFLPEDNAARQDFEAVQASMGPGWPTPYNVVIASDDRPITDPKLLRKVEAFQIRLAKDPRVDSVAGPGVFRAETADLGSLKEKLNESSELLGGAGKDLATLEGGLGEAGTGATTLQGGLSEAAAGADQLQGGGSDAQDGARKLKNGLASARAGSLQIQGGLDQALEGATALKGGAADALAGSSTIAKNLGVADETVKEGLPSIEQMAGNVDTSHAQVQKATGDVKTLNAQLASALNATQAMTDGKQDARYDDLIAALNAARSTAGSVGSTLGAAESNLNSADFVAGAFADQVGQLSSGLGQLYAGSSDLTAGLARLKTGNSDLAGGIEKLSGGGGELSSGLAQLQDGAGQLEQGLGTLSGGAGELGGGLKSGVPKVGELASGLGLMKSGVTKFRRNLPSTEDLDRLQAQSPGLFDSGYFVLAAIEGAPPGDRNQAAFAVNLDRGGSAGQITVIPKQASSSEATQQLGEDLVVEAKAFASSTGTDVAVGGPAGELADFQSSISADIWPVVISVTVAVTLLMMIALRSVLLPLATVAFNLLAVGATFGVITLLTTGDDPVLGGPGYIDALQVIETFAAAFGIALVFEMLLLYRTREMFLKSGDEHEALSHGLRETAGAATGAAVVMVAAIIPFTQSGLFNLRLTVGLAVAIVLDAVIVRPVLLPAAVEVLGRRGWWPTSRSAPPPPAVPAEPAPPAPEPAPEREVPVGA
ncbi:MAG: MMPL family transporter [Thermoleophilaceae bacterium]|nr:MMPL family transporter [Thermoleophilaceae bacterium]